MTAVAWHTRTAVVGLLAALAGASGSAPPTFVVTPPPRSNASARGPASLAFVSPRVGFAATTGGVRFVPREGWLRPRDLGRIERTDDGGVTWRTLWSGRRVVFGSITVSRRTIAALGYVARRMGRDRADEPVGPRLLVASADGGRTWQRRAGPPGGGSVQVLTPRIWIASHARDFEDYPVRPATGFRSDDAGRHWRRLELPRSPQLVRFVTSEIGFAGARGDACPRASQLSRTADGGKTWIPVPGTCGRPYTAFDVVSPRVLVAAQADDVDSVRPRSLIRRSTDGGRSWRIVRRESGRRIEQLYFADARHGFVVTAEPHFDGRLVHIRLRGTGDGGRTWSPRSLPYTEFDPYRSASTNGPELPGAFVGARYAWAGDDGAGLVWRTDDGARTWRLSANPKTLEPSEPTLGPRGTVNVSSSAGWVSSRDGGRTWRLSHRPSARAIAIGEHRGAYLAWGRVHDERGWRSDAIPMVTPDGGKTWRRVRLPGPMRDAHLGDGAVAFTSARDGLVEGDGSDLPPSAYSTHDGGRSWRAIQTPPGVSNLADVFLAPGVVVVAPGSRVFVTVDEGRTWRSFPTARDAYVCAVERPTRADIWIVCGLLASRRVVVTSHDGGKTWLRRTTGELIDEGQIAAVDGREAWTASADLTPERHGRLWQTTDGGSTWRQVWIALSPNARVTQVTS